MPTPVGIRRSSRYLPEVEALRGIAMALVFVFHLSAHVAGPMTATEANRMTIWWAFVRAGHTGVSLFFVLSGFLLSLPFLEEAAGGRAVSRRQFFARRALRILPLYYVAVLFGAAMTVPRLADMSVALPYLFFLNLVPGLVVPLAPYSATWWSLATEAQYYLLLPLLPFVIGPPRRGVLGLAVLVAYAIGYGLYISGNGPRLSLQTGMMLKLTVWGRGPLFLFGIAVAVLYRSVKPAGRAATAMPRWVARGGSDVLLIGLVVALGLLLRWTLRQGYQQAESFPNFAWHLPEGILWALVLGVIVMVPFRLKRLIVNPVWAWLGILSYSMYLWHTAVIHWVLRLLSRVPGWHSAVGQSWKLAVGVAIIIAVSVLISQLTYTLIERPFLIRKAKFD